MNKAEIFYFSGTGNSLAVARDIAEKNNGKLIPIASVMDKGKISPDSDVIGIIFPVYFALFGGIPLIVERFIKKLENINSKYIFAVCTYANGTGSAIDNLNKLLLLCGNKLAAGFAVQMPYNYILGSRLSTIKTEKQQEIFKNWKKKLEIIYEYINTKKEGGLETNVMSGKGLRGLVLRLLSNNSTLRSAFKKMYKSFWQKMAGFAKNIEMPFSEILPLIDKSFHSDGRCDGCGICGKVCPVNNIEMIDKKPSWKHHCEQCFACLQWCPKAAIQLGKETIGKRYHHPDIKLADMFNIMDYKQV